MCPQPPTLPFPLGTDVPVPSTPYSSTLSIPGLYLVHGGPVPVLPPSFSSPFSPCPRCTLEIPSTEFSRPGFYCSHIHTVVFPYREGEGGKVVRLQRGSFFCFGRRCTPAHLPRFQTRSLLEFFYHVHHCPQATEYLRIDPSKSEAKEGAGGVGGTKLASAFVEVETQGSSSTSSSNSDSTSSLSSAFLDVSTTGGLTLPLTDVDLDSIDFDAIAANFTPEEWSELGNLTLPALSPSTTSSSSSSDASSQSDASLLWEPTPLVAHSYFSDLTSLPNPKFDPNGALEVEVEVESRTSFRRFEQEEEEEEEEGEDDLGLAWLGCWWSLIEEAYK